MVAPSLQLCPVLPTGQRRSALQLMTTTWWFPPSSVQTLANVFPRSAIQAIQGVGHIAMVDYPARTARKYLEFRAKLATQA